MESNHFGPVIPEKLKSLGNRIRERLNAKKRVFTNHRSKTASI